MNAVHLAAVLPQDRDPEPTGKYVDSRYRPSFVDLGHLQSRACAMAGRYRVRSDADYPEAFLSDLRRLIRTSVRHVETIDIQPELETVVFSARDQWGAYTYSFSVKRGWFRKE